jgi:hypothetical protein
MLAYLVHHDRQDKGNKLIHDEHEEPEFHVVFCGVPHQGVLKGPDIVMKTYETAGGIHDAEIKKADHHPQDDGIIFEQKKADDSRGDKQPAGVKTPDRKPLALRLYVIIAHRFVLCNPYGEKGGFRPLF